MKDNISELNEIENKLNDSLESIDKTDKESKKECKKEDKKCKKLESEIEKLTKELEKVKSESLGKDEKVLRFQAELMNFKRRKEEENSYNMKYKNEDILKSLLPVIDNFERGLMMDDNDLSDEVSKFLSGFKMIYTEIIGILNKNEVKEIEAEGIEFNPVVHQAVLMEHDENKPSGVVLEVLQKGYMYKDKVIRPAMVKVNE